MILDIVRAMGIVRHALLALIGPRIGRLDAVGRVVREGERNSTRRRDRQQMAVAHAVRGDFFRELGRQPRRKPRRGEILFGVEQRERAFFLRNRVGCRVRFIAHEFGDRSTHAPRLLGIVFEPEHDQRVAEPGEPEPDAALGARFGVLLRQRPHRHVEHVVEHAHRRMYDTRERPEIEARFGPEGVRHERGEIDAAQAAAAVRRQRLLAAGIRGIKTLAV